MFCSCGRVRTAGFWGTGGAFPSRTLEDDDTEDARLAVIPLSACSDVGPLELLYFALDEGVFLLSFWRGKIRFSPLSANPVSVSWLNKSWWIDDLGVINQSGSLLGAKGFDDL